MEDRKSILETVTPRDALGRLSARQKHSKLVVVLIGVVVLFVAALLVGLIISKATQGTRGIDVPTVAR